MPAGRRLDRAAYDRSQIDWRRLHEYARRVAQETTRPRHAEPVSRTELREHTEARLFGLWRRTISRPVTTTVEQDAGYWILEARHWRRTECIKPHYETTDSEETWYCLTTDGRLVVRHQAFYEGLNAQGYYGPNPDGDVRERDFDDQDVILFDFAPYAFYQDKGGTIVRSDINPSGRLVRHAKGVGLSLVLKNLLS